MWTDQLFWEGKRTSLTGNRTRISIFTMLIPLTLRGNCAWPLTRMRPILERQNLPQAPQMKLASALELLKPHVFMEANSESWCPDLNRLSARVFHWIRNMGIWNGAGQFTPQASTSKLHLGSVNLDSLTERIINSSSIRRQSKSITAENGIRTHACRAQ